MNHRTHMVLMVGLAGLALTQAITGFAGGWVLYVLVGGYAWMTYLMMRGRRRPPAKKTHQTGHARRRS
jgi:hypothetical protein